MTGPEYRRHRDAYAWEDAWIQLGQGVAQELADGTRETLREDAEFVLYRNLGRSSINGALNTRLVVVPVREHTPPRVLRRMEHEYSLREEQPGSDSAARVRWRSISS